MNERRIDRVTSDKIKAITVICSLSVVFGHAYNLWAQDVALLEARCRTDAWWCISTWAETIVRHGLIRVATPFFFAVSAYLLFSKAWGGRAGYLREVHERVHSLGVPLLAWSAIGAGIFAAIQALAPAPYDLPVNRDGRPLWWETWLVVSPVSYQLWFLRDLFLLVILSPLLRLLLVRRAMAIATLAVVAVPWCVAFDSGHTRALAFFCLGGFLALHPLRLEVRAAWHRAIPVALWVVSMVANAWCVLVLGQEYAWIRNPMVLLGLTSLWLIHDHLPPLAQRPVVAAIVPYTFFIYAMHEPIDSVMKLLLRQAFASGPVWILAASLVSGALTYGICFGTARLLDQYLPRVYRFLSGGRAGSERRASSVVVAPAA